MPPLPPPSLQKPSHTNLLRFGTPARCFVPFILHGKGTGVALPLMLIDIQNVHIIRNGIGCPACGGKLKKVERKTLATRLRDSFRISKKPVRYQCQDCKNEVRIF